MEAHGAYVKVRDLAEWLKDQDPDAVVVLSSDPEGNRYSPVHAFGAARYKPDSNWTGEVDHPTEPFDEQTSIPVVCLWPG